MQLSAQEEYGLRCLLQVARHEETANAEPLRIPDIANAEGLSPEYAAKLMRVLRQGGLVVSTRGAAGGYRLARAPDHITVWEVLSVLGGPLFTDTFCASHPGQLRDCVHTTDCSVRALWRWVGGAVRDALRSVSLADMYRGEHPMGRWLDTDQPMVNFATALAREGRAKPGSGPATGHTTGLSTGLRTGAVTKENP